MRVHHSLPIVFGMIVTLMAFAAHHAMAATARSESRAERRGRLETGSNVVHVLADVTPGRASMSKRIAVAAGLACAVACAGESPPSHARESAAATATRVPGSPSQDTAFFELERVARANRRTTEGGCRFTGGIDDPKSLRLPQGAAYEERVVSLDRRTCATMVARGYRLRVPDLDTAGTAGRKVSTTTVSFPDSLIRPRYRPQ